MDLNKTQRNTKEHKEHCKKTSGATESRQRALRLIKRVAKAVNDREARTREEIIALCTEHTTQTVSPSILDDFLPQISSKGASSFSLGSRLLGLNGCINHNRFG